MEFKCTRCGNESNGLAEDRPDFIPNYCPKCGLKNEKHVDDATCSSEK